MSKSALSNHILHGLTFYHKRSVMRFSMVFLALVIMCLQSTAYAAVTVPEETASDYVKKTAVEAIGVLSDKTSEKTDRRDTFGKIIEKSFDIPTIARYVTGSYWKKADPEQQSEFVSVFNRALTQIYVARFFKYDASSLRVIDVLHPEDEISTVKSIVAAPTRNENYKVDWLVINIDGTHKFLDVVIDGISTNRTTKQDYLSVLRTSSGNLDVLTGRLQKILDRGIQ